MLEGIIQKAPAIRDFSAGLLGKELLNVKRYTWKKHLLWTGGLLLSIALSVVIYYVSQATF